MKITASQFNAAVAALDHVWPMTRPADAVLSDYFRRNHQLGAHDRAFVAEILFGALRRRIGLEYQTGAAGPRPLLLAHLNRIEGISLRQLAPLMSPQETQWLQTSRAREETPPLHVQAELPDWVTSRLELTMPEPEIVALGRALSQPGPLDLRVNTMLASREDVLRELRAEGITATATPYSPFGVRLSNKRSLHRHPLFLSGKIEVQDEGSQILALLMAPKRREMVVDFCAGAGGKTLMLGALMHSTGRLYAFDVSQVRLDKFGPRLKRSGLSNVYPQRLQSEHDAKIGRLKGKIDRVLVDAPCSGLGTLRRNPDLKWRHSPASIAELTLKQANILKAAASLLKPGGRIVYATCSLLSEENQNVVSAFIGQNSGYSLIPAGPVLKAQDVPLDTGQFLELLPHRHGCDGFFAAVIERI